MPVLISELFDLPAQVRQGDFVLRLTEGVQKPDETIANYVLTEQLVKCFDHGLGLIQSAMEARSSKGTYLHGSFGSGKSHFMAVLMLLLEHHPAAWGIPDLAAVLGKHPWARERRFLLVPYHMIGAKDLTSALLGGYVNRVLQLHPDKPHPGVYRSEAILDSARSLRTRMGDKTFFESLNPRGGEGKPDDGWGSLGAAWDTGTFEAACRAHPADASRVRLVGDLVATLFMHARDTTEFVDLDNGLAIMSQHARSLGYDAVILFLDELILWLAGYAASPGFVTQQGQLLSKLVEAQNPNRPAPLVSFVARQRDLRELVGENMLGNEYVSFTNSLQWWEERFDVLKLEDRNLATIAQKRVLKPKSESARQQIEQAFRETERVRKEVMDILLTSHGSRDEFHKIYPFSPALMETLVALSSLLQRERTALKIMFQLLVEQQHRLKLGDLVPVGDLFDVLLNDAQPLSNALAGHFDQARKLYRQRLLPLIETQHGMKRDEVDRMPFDDPRAMAFRRDDRLAKTLLLSALAPEVEAFKGMTVNRLAALNHGTIRSPISGKEGQVVYTVVRAWAAAIGQIRLGDEPTNPKVSVQLAAVDLDSILRAAGSEDNPGNRIRKVKELVYEMMGFQQADDFWVPHPFTWRATKRRCQILFSNVRELNDESLRNAEAEWKVILDFPFDPESTCGPRDDLALLREFRTRNPEGARTLVWMPSFLSKSAQDELGQLVLHEHVVAGSRLENYASHLSAVDRSQARVLLENQRSALKQRVRAYLEAAYGLGSETGALDSTHALEPDEHIVSLDDSVDPPIPAGANLGQAVGQVLDAALAAQFPGHPRFEPETKTTGVTVKRVLAELEKALGTADGRSLMDPAIRRDVKLLAEPLKLASTGDTHLVLSTHWKNHFAQKRAEAGGGPMTVRLIRTWIDKPQMMGLPEELQDLVILIFAVQTDSTFVMHGAAIQPALGALRPDMELREQPLPPDAAWKTAVERAPAMFGLVPAPVRNASSVDRLSADLRSRANELLPAAQSLAREISIRLPWAGLDTTTVPRGVTTSESLQILEGLRSATDRNLIESFAAVPLKSAPLTLGTTMRSAAEVATALKNTRWEIFDGICRFADERAAAAAGIRQELIQALSNDQQTIDLCAALRRLEGDATRLLVAVPTLPPPSPPASPGPVPRPPGGSPPGPVPSPGGLPGPSGRVDIARSWQGSDEEEVAAFYANHPEKLERNRALVCKLKELYRASQVKGDDLPAGLPWKAMQVVLEVHHIRPLSQGGPDEWSNMIVLSSNLHALVHADTGCRIDQARREMILFGVRLTIEVHGDHLAL